ncbi:hypothetical protein Q4610_19050 [Sphingobium sp. HBC34]|uniref:Uncharacterized protein n=1 Tax=Sphingobium cyanobacteriorum TaxID=3063954 RepID=A0ABT8ZRH7_9SPHN|nr:hypothetical protein [Sphingobium sp. HBC34]MDO7837147.1 hypothetical protein [Sphingobium sp. HBC34]
MALVGKICGATPATPATAASLANFGTYARTTNMDEKLLNLPWEIQLALGSGYVAYMLAYLGIREHHKAIDVTFRTIAFGLCATAVLTLLPARFGWWRASAAIVVAIVGGGLWRFFLADAMLWVVRKIDLSWSDETPSAWSRITQHNRKIYYCQITVHLEDDSVLFCNDTRPFADAPFGPCILGPNGDIALYVTHRCEPGAKKFVAIDGIRDQYHGDELTFIPASKVRKVKVRLLKRPTG